MPAVFPIRRAVLIAGAIAVLTPNRAGAEPRPRAELRGYDYPIWSVAFSPDGKTLIGLEGTDPKAWVHVWDVTTGKAAHSIRISSPALMGSLAISPDGRLIATAGGTVTLSRPDGGPPRRIDDPSGDAFTLAFSPDGKTLAVGGGDRKTAMLELYDVVTGRRRNTLAGHTMAVGGVQFTPDGKHLVSGGYDKTVRVWDAATGAAVATRDGHDRGIESVIIRPDGKLAASADLGGTVRLWELPSAKEAGVLKGLPGGVLSAAFSPDGRLLAAATGKFATDGEVWLWDVGTLKRVARIRGEPVPVRSVAFSPDGKTLASVSGYEPVRLWAVADLLSDQKD